MGLTPTLFVNLHNTRLPDFSLHFIQRIDLSIVSDDGDPPRDQMKWRVVMVEPETEIGPVMRGHEFLYWHLESAPGLTHTLLQIDQVGETFRSWGLYTKEDLLTDTPTFWLMGSHYNSDILNVVMLEDIERKGQGSDALLAWMRLHWGNDVEPLPLENAPKTANIGNVLDITPKEETRRKASIADYLYTEKKLIQKLACEFASIDPKTYRTYKQNGWLLSADKYRRVWGKSIEAAGAEVYRG